jgi:hypothetical protein
VSLLFDEEQEILSEKCKMTNLSTEELVGISEYLNKDNPGFWGTIKERMLYNCLKWRKILRIRNYYAVAQL